MELVMMLFYRVQDGDTFEAIANKFNMKRGKLASLNTEFMEGGTRSIDIICVGELLRIQ